MPFIEYVPKNFHAKTMAIIEAANAIIDEYTAEGYQLTLRQLYYQFVARDLLPNRQREYNRLGSIINDARLAGLIDWDAIEDRTRNLEELAHWDSPRGILAGAAGQYRVDKWSNQPNRVEVWIEKEALAGVIERICTELDVPYFSCRGYVSQSEMWAAAERFIEHRDGGQDCIILHFGDHDPSGIDMTRDIEDRMELFGADVDVRRLALNMDQVRQYNPPPNPAKFTDSRAVGYVSRYGRQSWELDALDPRTLSALVRDAVDDVRDDEAWEERAAKEDRERNLLKLTTARWAEVVEFLENGGGAS